MSHGGETDTDLVANLAEGDRQMRGSNWPIRAGKPAAILRSDTIVREHRTYLLYYILPSYRVLYVFIGRRRSERKGRKTAAFESSLERR